MAGQHLGSDHHAMQYVATLGCSVHAQPTGAQPACFATLKTSTVSLRCACDTVGCAVLLSTGALTPWAVCGLCCSDLRS